MGGLNSGFDVARAGWEFPEGICAGIKGHPSDPVAEWLDTNHRPAINGVKVHDNEVAALPGPNADDADSNQKAVRICFSAAGEAGLRTKWDAVLWQNRLYVSVTQTHLTNGSKKAFVSLLEYAEEELKVAHVVACLDKTQHDNKNVIRNFLFLGFQPLGPGHEYFPSNPNLVCFLYTI